MARDKLYRPTAGAPAVRDYWAQSDAPVHTSRLVVPFIILAAIGGWCLLARAVVWALGL